YAVFERLPDAVLVADAGGRCLDANIAATHLLGYPRDEIARLHVAAVLTDAPADGGAWFSRFVKAGEWQGELRVRRQDGALLPVEVSAIVVPEASGDVYIAVLHEGGQGSLIERQAAVAESSDDAIVGTTLDGMITSWNSGAERLYGYAAADVIGRSIALVVPPDRSSELPDILSRLQQGQHIVQFETERLARDGRRLG